MPKSATVTYETVSETAEKLQQAGLQPTIKNIREALGSGSPNTIHKFLTMWRERMPATIKPKIELPPNITEAVHQTINEAVAAVREEMGTLLQTAKAEAAELSDIGVKIEAERNYFESEVNVLTSKLNQVEATAAERINEIVRLTKELETERNSSETARIEIAQLRIRMENQAEILRRGEESANDDRSTLRATEERLRETEKALAIEVTRHEAAELELKKADIREKVAGSRAEAAESKCNDCAQELADARARLELHNNELTEYRDRLKSVIDELKTYKEEMIKGRDIVARLSEEAAELRGQLKSSKKGEPKE